MDFSFFMIFVFNFFCFCSLADTLKLLLKEDISTSLLVFNKGSANIGSKISLVIKTKYVREVILSLGLEPIFLNIILIYLILFIPVWIQNLFIFLFSLIYRNQCE